MSDRFRESPGGEIEAGVREQEAMTASDAVPADAPRPRGNFIARHWRGELPLWVSYWVIGFGGTFVSRLAVLGVENGLPRTPIGAEAAYVAEIALTWAIALAVAVWQVVGTWRSATRHAAVRRAAGRRPVWATLAKAVMVISVVATGVQVLRAGVPQAIDVYEAVWLGDPDLPEYSIRVMRQGREAEYTGGVRLGSAEALRETLDRNPKIEVLHLTSIGGRFTEAQKMYALVRARGIATYVPTSCESACTLVFAAGRKRWIAPDASIGFHGPTFGAFDELAAQEGLREWRAALVDAGYEPAFVDRGIAIPAEEMWYPTHEELRAARVTTDTTDGSQFAVSGYGGTVTRADMESLGELIPAFQTLQEKSTARFEAAADVVIAAYDAGQTPKQTARTIRLALGAPLVAYAPEADEAVLIDYSALSTMELEEIRGVSSGLCYRAATGGDFDVIGTHYVNEDLRSFELDVIEQVIATASPRPAPSDAEIAPAIARLDAALAERLGERRLALLAAPEVPVEREDEYCASVITLGRVIGELPEDEAAMILRRLTLSRREGTVDAALPPAVRRHFLVE
jgi:hypothetical protein